VAAAVAATDLDGVTGRIRFEPNGERRDLNMTVWRVEQGICRLLGSARELAPV
jgi:ABC-type branched-subunit amino acid transport system substrate-binding protein